MSMLHFVDGMMRGSTLGSAISILRASCRTYSVPILALQGADDPYGTDEQLRVFEANVGAPITTQLIPGARHSPHVEATEETLAAITGFVAQLPRRSST